MFAIKDRRYDVRVLHEVKNSAEEDKKLSPMGFADLIRYQFRDGGVDIVEHESSVITLRYDSCCANKNPVSIDAEHVVAYFALLTYGSNFCVVKQNS